MNFVQKFNNQDYNEELLRILKENGTSEKTSNQKPEPDKNSIKQTRMRNRRVKTRKMVGSYKQRNLFLRQVGEFSERRDTDEKKKRGKNLLGSIRNTGNFLFL